MNNDTARRSPAVLLLLSAAFLQSAAAFVGTPVNYGAPSPDEQLALDKINRFRDAPLSELSVMFTESFTGSYTNSDVQTLLENVNWSADFWVNTFGGNLASYSMDFFQTRPGTLYSQFQTLSSAPALTWSDSIGWAAHQYAVWVERDAGATANPHAVAGAPSLGARFTGAGVGWTSIGENIAPDWPLDVNLMHMGFAVDWGFGTDGIQDPAGHRISMLNPNYNSIGIGITDAGWGPGDVTQVQHFANVNSTQPITYGFVFAADGTTRQAGVTVTLYDAANNPVGTATTDAIGAYTVIGPFVSAPVTAVYDDGTLVSPQLALGGSGGNWFLDVTMVPEPSSVMLFGLAVGFAGFRRKVRR